MACGGGAKSVTGPAFLPVEDAELPYRVLRAKSGREVSLPDFYAEIKAAQAVCVGESHSDSHHHWAQLEILQHVLQRLPAASERKLATGMEMFQRPFQGVLDDYVEGRISEEQMLSRSGWKGRWRYDWNYYAPMVRLTVERGAALLALNISKELKEKWKKSGSEGLSEAEKAKLPEMILDDQEHRRWFRALMERIGEGHEVDRTGNHAFEGDPHGSTPAPAVHGHAGAAAQPAQAPKEATTITPDFIEKIYPVQVLWDETMADTATQWLQAEEGRQLIILAGNGHCHDTAIVGRMKRRGVGRVVSVRPVTETGAGEVADLLASPMNDYLFVMDKQGKSGK